MRLWVPYVCLITILPLSYELWKLRTTFGCFQFSVSITHNSKIRELSDGNRVIVCQTNFFAMGLIILWVMSYKNRELSYQKTQSKQALIYFFVCCFLQSIIFLSLTSKKKNFVRYYMTRPNKSKDKLLTCFGRNKLQYIFGLALVHLPIKIFSAFTYFWVQIYVISTFFRKFKNFMKQMVASDKITLAILFHMEDIPTKHISLSTISDL